MQSRLGDVCSDCGWSSILPNSLDLKEGVLLPMYMYLSLLIVIYRSMTSRVEFENNAAHKRRKHAPNAQSSIVVHHNYSIVNLFLGSEVGLEC